jgi:hypothetical protein
MVYPISHDITSHTHPFYVLHELTLSMPIGFVNPGCVLPPIADPQLYFLYDKARLKSQKAEVRKRESFIGDRIYVGCLIYVLEQWRFPRRCILLLYDTFISKIYQERLFDKWNVFDFLSHGQGWTRNTRAEAIEVHQFQTTFPPSHSKKNCFLLNIFVLANIIDLLFHSFERSAL